MGEDPGAATILGSPSGWRDAEFPGQVCETGLSRKRGLYLATLGRHHQDFD
jgi:hypothetical protein